MVSHAVRKTLGLQWMGNWYIKILFVCVSLLSHFWPIHFYNTCYYQSFVDLVKQCVQKLPMRYILYTLVLIVLLKTSGENMSPMRYSVVNILFKFSEYLKWGHSFLQDVLIEIFYMNVNKLQNTCPEVPNWYSFGVSQPLSQWTRRTWLQTLYKTIFSNLNSNSK